MLYWEDSVTKHAAVDQAATWYAATLVFSSHVGDLPSLRPLCEERVVLFRAANESLAAAAAAAYGSTQEHSYRNTYGELLRWRFAGVDKIECLPAPDEQNGWEVASRLIRRSRRTLQKLERPTERTSAGRR